MKQLRVVVCLLALSLRAARDELPAERLAAAAQLDL